MISRYTIVLRNYRAINTVLNARYVSSNISKLSNSASTTPLIESYRSSWPENKPKTVPISDDVIKRQLPARTVSDDVLCFEMSATYDQGSSLFYPHMKTNPADFKVILKVIVVVVFLYILNV